MSLKSNISLFLAGLAVGIIVGIILLPTKPTPIQGEEDKTWIVVDSLKRSILQKQVIIDSLEQLQTRSDGVVVKLKEDISHLQDQRRNRYEEAKKIPVHALRDSIINRYSKSPG